MIGVERGCGWEVTFGFEARVGEIVGFGFGFADFELGFLVRWLVCWLVGMGGGMDGRGVWGYLEVLLLLLLLFGAGAHGYNV